jgi:hypothetical protein
MAQALAAPPRARNAEALPQPASETGVAAVANDLDREYAYAQFVPEVRAAEDPGIYRSGAYSTLGFVGASILAAGLLAPFTGIASLTVTVALVLAGAAIASFGWRHAWNILERIEVVGSSATGTRAATCGAA